MKHCDLTTVLINDLMPLGPNPEANNPLFNQLVRSIGEHGQVNPISATWDKDAKRYRVVDGALRVHALVRLGKKEVLAYVWW